MPDSTTLPAQRLTLRSVLKWLVFAAVAGFIAWRIVAINMADYFASRGDPASAERALMFIARHPDALEILARDRMADDPAAAVAYLQESLKANPIRGMTYALLGAAWDRLGETDKASRAIEAAVKLAPAQVDVHLIAAAHYLARNDVDGLLRHWSVGLTRRGSLAAEIYPSLLSLLDNPAHRPAFARLLQKPVAWWSNFVAFAANKAEKITLATAAYELSLQSAANPLKPYALGAVLSRLQRDNLWLDARLAWLDSLPHEQLDGLPEVFNGGFEQPLSGIGFDWVARKAGHIVIDTAPTAGASGDKALYVLFRGPRVRFAHLHQYLALQPGNYLLRGRGRADDLQTNRGLMWTLACVGGPREKQIAATEPVVGRTPWKKFEVAFSVPAADCPAQRLRLQLDGKVALDFDASGQAWFDDLEVLPAN